MAGSRPPVQLVQGEPISTRQTRVLLGWLGEMEAAQCLFGRAAANPTEEEEVRTRLAAARGRVEARPETAVDNPIAPRTGEIDAKLKEVAQRTDIQGQFAGHQWRPEWVDLRSVLSFQKVVATDNLPERLEVARTTDGLFELCLPSTPTVPPQGVISDPDGKGLTISALNPNLRFAGSHVSQVMVSQAAGMPQVPMQAVTFFVTMGSSYVQVAKYNGRYFVRDGYHRVAGLLQAGIHFAPCIFIEARTFEEMGCPPGSITFETLYGKRPPKVTDFWDDDVASAGKQMAIRKVVRLAVQEFMVPR